jgi:hypothetical protein
MASLSDLDARLKLLESSSTSCSTTASLASLNASHLTQLRNIRSLLASQNASEGNGNVTADAVSAKDEEIRLLKEEVSKRDYRIEILKEALGKVEGR